MRIMSQVTLKGNALEAAMLYEKAFSTKMSEVITYKDLKRNNKQNIFIPKEMEDMVIHLIIKIGNGYIKLSDNLGEINLAKTEMISLAIECTIEEGKQAYRVLSQGSEVIVPPSKTSFSEYYCSLIDKFGVKWEIESED